MRTSCVKNGLVFGVILLFIGVAVQPVITAVDNDTDVNDISIDNSDEIEPLDDYKEIFTHIDGVCRNFTVKRRGIFIHRGVEMYAHGSWGITISGIRFPFNFFEEEDNLEDLFDTPKPQVSKAAPNELDDLESLFEGTKLFPPSI